MSTHCEFGQAATITIQFADRKEVISIAKSPVIVETSKGTNLFSNFDDNYSDNSGDCSYQINYKDGTSETLTLGVGGQLNVNLNKEVISISTSDTWTNSGVPGVACPYVDAPTNPRGTGFGGGRLYDSLHIEKFCTIKVFDSDNILQLQMSGQCPVTYTVACGSECPKGTKKKRITTYPGYCCQCGCC